MTKSIKFALVTNFLYRPSCPPAFRINDYDALSEGDKAEDDEEEEEEEEENREEEEEEEEDEEEYEWVDEEVEGEVEPGTEVAGDEEPPPRKKISIRRKNFSASRSPAPERVDGAQAEKDAEVNKYVGEPKPKPYRTRRNSDLSPHTNKFRWRSVR